MKSKTTKIATSKLTKKQVNDIEKTRAQRIAELLNKLRVIQADPSDQQLQEQKALRNQLRKNDYRISKLSDFRIFALNNHNSIDHIEKLRERIA